MIHAVHDEAAKKKKKKKNTQYSNFKALDVCLVCVTIEPCIAICLYLHPRESRIIQITYFIREIYVSHYFLPYPLNKSDKN